RLALTGTDPEQTAATINALADRFVNVAADLKRDRLDQVTGVLQEQLRYAEDNLRNAEMQLEGFRIQTVTLPTDQAPPVAPGLASTQAPVMSRFFGLRIEAEQLRSDREAIARIIAAARDSTLSLDALALIPTVQSSAAL